MANWNRKLKVWKECLSYERCCGRLTVRVAAVLCHQKRSAPEVIVLLAVLYCSYKNGLVLIGHYHRHRHKQLIVELLWRMTLLRRLSWFTPWQSAPPGHQFSVVSSWGPARSWLVSSGVHCVGRAGAGRSSARAMCGSCESFGEHCVWLCAN